VLVDKPHVRDFDHFHCLFGSNPKDLSDFDVEVEMHLDGEKKSLMSLP
jgi:hypothetical protein